MRDNDRRIVELACHQLASAAAKLGEEDLLPVATLQETLTFVRSVLGAAEALPCDDADNSAYPPIIGLEDDLSVIAIPNSGGDSNNGIHQILLPLFDRLTREDDVNGLAGAPIVLPKYVPVDFLMLPTHALTLEDAIAAIRFCDRLCTLISVQGHCVKNRGLHKVALIEHVMTHVLPMPKPVTADDVAKCIWRTPMRYGVQLDLTICLGRILEHYISASYSLHLTKSKDALNLVITACIAALADVVLRRAATDQPSEFCLHLMGSNDAGVNQAHRIGRGEGFGLSMHNFAQQSETIVLHTPELNIARTAVLDYFEAQGNLTKMFNWNENHRPEEAAMKFLAGLSSDLAFPSGAEQLIQYIEKGNALVNKNYPEFHVYRDIAFYLKYCQNVDPRAFPRKAEYQQIHAELKWEFDAQSGAFTIKALGMELFAYPQPPFDKALHRYPSVTNPSVLAQPHQIKTEDDVLHIKNLPDFKDCLSQQDCELLLSYLTVPYLRIPLVISLFATEDRIHSLRSEQLQEVLDAVMFEPGIHMSCERATAPTQVPASDARALATSFGLLFNELYRLACVRVIFE